jgi:folate-binding protein YgfZ
MNTYDAISAALRDAAALWLPHAEFGLVELSGPDAAEFLHRLCSQDVAALADGEVRPAAFLNPKGKLVAVCRVGRLADRYVVETALGARAEVAELLDRYHFTERLGIRVRDDLACGAVVGTDALAASGWTAGSVRQVGGGLGLAVERHGLQRVAWHLPPNESAPADVVARLPLATPERAELLRIVAGDVAVGIDTDATTLALEAALDDHVSTTKGCYTGQEIVARIHTYGHVNRQLRLLQIDVDVAPAPGTSLVETEDGEKVGRTMSAVRFADGRVAALGYVAREFATAGTALRLAGADAPVQVCDFGPPNATAT